MELALSQPPHSLRQPVGELEKYMESLANKSRSTETWMDNLKEKVPEGDRRNVFLEPRISKVFSPETMEGMCMGFLYHLTIFQVWVHSFQPAHLKSHI